LYFGIAAVEPSRQGAGWGGRLLTFAESEALRLGLPCVRLTSVREEGTPAVLRSTRLRRPEGDAMPDRALGLGRALPLRRAREGRSRPASRREPGLTYLRTMTAPIAPGPVYTPITGPR
jgi:hypothetical protein